jgi:adenine deaminase
VEPIRPDLAPTGEEIARLRAVARGEAQADLAIRRAAVALVHTGESLEGDLLVAGRHIAAVTPPGRLPRAATEVDATGMHLLPGFCECHLHIEYTLLPPGELARLVVPRGTTSVFADPNCSANVFGRRGIDLLAATGAPFHLFLQVSARAPRSPHLEEGGATLAIPEIVELLGDPRAASYGESTPYDDDPEIHRALAAALAAGRRANGHTARLDGEPLWAQLAGGIADDHNAATLDEALERIRRGASIALHSSSMASYLEGILGQPGRLGMAAAHIMFCADDKYADDLAAEGHIDHHLRRAVALGVPPVLAVRMATLNAAAHFHVDHLIGSLAPSRVADLVLVPDLVSFRPAAVWVGGRLVAEDGVARFDNLDAYPDWALDSIRLGRPLTASDFAVTAPGPGRYEVRVIQMHEGFYKRALTEVVATGPGNVLAPDPARDLARMAAVDRHKGRGLVGKAFIRGFGLRSGALAVSTICENQNIAVVGTSDAECAAAVNALAEIGGGFVVTDGGRRVAEVPLRYGGMMSTERYETVLRQLEAAKRAAAALGCRVPSPFMMLSFVGLAAIPELGLTERGLIDVATQRFVDVIVGRRPAGEPAPSLG